MKRLYYLDYLKVALTVLVVFHHAAIPYSPGREWAYTTSHPEEMMPWIWHFLSTNASFFMGLFFLISGYFVPRSFDSQGTVTDRKSTRLNSSHTDYLVCRLLLAHV